MTPTFGLLAMLLQYVPPQIVFPCKAVLRANRRIRAIVMVTVESASIVSCLVPYQILLKAKGNSISHATAL